ncbi:Hypothetical predicted protein [Paramuricea clavata]|uniref:Uncharacterized protein n=1 Tax=Paramuricea clavata TaxID=317549 RepID=A0A6S7I761_PARCT|nr:Hypothetical predicted protein [Paramuricea clavata]
MKKKKDITSLKNKVNDNSEDKCSKIVKVGEPIVHHTSGSATGTWMRDPLGLLGTGKIWYMDGFNGDQVLEFKDMDHFKGGEVAKTYTLPYKFDGTGSVVYGRYLYFNRANTTHIVKYDLVTEKIARETVIRVKPRKFSYEWGGYNTVDLSVDESGLWILYTYWSYNVAHLCVQLRDPLTLGKLQHYCFISSETRNKMGNAFVACGVVYCIDSYNSATTTINSAYDTATFSGNNPEIKFVNKFKYNSMVTYNPREKVLYAWDNNRQITYPLEFEDETKT